jgi:hypothetical protein
MGCVNLYAATTARGIVDFELAGNSCRTSAPDIGIMQKWYGFAVEGEDVAALAARIIKRGKIHHNTFHECDGRVIQVYHGQQIDVESNIVTDMAPGDTYGANELRFIGTDDSVIADNVVTVGSTGHGNCFYIGGVANIAGDESKNITVSGNTCVHRGAVGSGYGLHIIGLQDGTITSNAFVNVNATGATRGIKIENVAGLTNQDIFIASNRIRGFSAWQVDIGTAAVRTVVGVNYLGRTAAGLSQFLNDTATGTRYLGWEYDKAGLITPNFIEVGANSAQSGNLRLPNTGSLRWRNAGATGELALTVGADDYLTSGVRFRAPGLGVNRTPLGDDLIYMKNAKGIYWRNAANTAEHWIALTASDVFEVSARMSVAKSVVSGLNVVTFSATPTFDASLGNTQKITLTGNVTSSTLSNASTGETINFIICQDATGSRTFVWPTNVKGGMTIGATLSTCSAQDFIFDGTNAYAVSSGVTNM